MSEPEADVKESRFRQGLAGKRTTILIAGVVAVIVLSPLVAFLVASHSRFDVVGKVDPSTRYRIRYTVSGRYHTISGERQTGSWSAAELEEKSYDPAPPPRAVRWVYDHIFHKQPVSSMAALGFGHTIQQFTYRGQQPEGTRADSQGYLDLTDVSEFGSIAFQSHRLVSGCPTSWFGMDVPGFFGGSQPSKYYCLLVHPKDAPISFCFVGISPVKGEPNDVLTEMTAIRDSIVVEKVKQ